MSEDIPKKKMQFFQVLDELKSWGRTENYQIRLDADEIINRKMTKNEAKYPVEKAKGKSTKNNKYLENE